MFGQCLLAGISPILSRYCNASCREEVDKGMVVTLSFIFAEGWAKQQMEIQMRNMQNTDFTVRNKDNRKERNGKKEDKNWSPENIRSSGQENRTT